MNTHSAVKNFVSGFTIIRRPKRGFWSLQIVGLLDTMGYWAMIGILVITLTDDFGVSDVRAGHLFSASVVAMTISLLFAGSIVDALGIRRALILGYVGSILARGAIFAVGFVPEHPLVQPIILIALVIMGPCVAVFHTVYAVGSKMFTYPEQQSAGFNVVYVALNVGAVGAGLMVDILFLKLDLPRYYVVGAGCALGLACLAITVMGIPNTIARESSEGQFRLSAVERIVELVRRAFREPTFWRLIAFVALLTPIRAVLIYYVLLAPKYWLRMIGPEAKIGFFQALNPMLVIMGTLAIIPYVARVNVYTAIAAGSFISATSLFILAIPPHDAHNIAAVTQTMSVLFLILLTAGEITWAPRTMQYPAAVAPAGLEATYLGVSGLPLGLSKMFIAFASGYMLQKWVPPNVAILLETNELSYWQSPAAMWLILAVIATASVTAIFILRPWITKGTVFASS